MKQPFFRVESHLCPDCQSGHAFGEDRFGYLMPCTRCVVKRLVKAMEADLDEQSEPMTCAA